MPLSWNEIKDRALQFARDWADAASEQAEAKTFWDAFFTTINGVYGDYRLKAYPIDSRYQVLFISDLTARGRAVLRRLAARPARLAPMLTEE